MSTQTKGKPFQEMLKEVFNGERECLHSPLEDVELGEVVIGTLEDPIGRSVYSFWQTQIRSFRDFHESLPENLSPNDKKKLDELQLSLHQHRHRLECTKNIFWEIIYTDFPQARANGVAIGIRKGWKVVVFKSESNGFGDLLKHILG
jgi:hypothetical protein